MYEESSMLQLYWFFVDLIYNFVRILKNISPNAYLYEKKNDFMWLRAKIKYFVTYSFYYSELWFSTSFIKNNNDEKKEGFIFLR